jgi:hypothetical protein
MDNQETHAAFGRKHRSKTNKARTNNKNNKENELHQKQGPTHELILA